MSKVTNEEIFEAGWYQGYNKEQFKEGWQNFLSKHPELAVEPEIEVGEWMELLNENIFHIGDQVLWPGNDGYVTLKCGHHLIGHPVGQLIARRRKVEPSPINENTLESLIERALRLVRNDHQDRRGNGKLIEDLANFKSERVPEPKSYLDMEGNRDLA